MANDLISTFPEILPEQRTAMHFAKVLDLGFPYKGAGMFRYGSSVYKNKTPSDVDIICIFVGQIDYCEQHVIPQLDDAAKTIEVTLYSEKTFLEKVNQHEISVLECLFAESKNILVPLSYYIEVQLKHFTIDKPKLRESISAKASNSYVKAKKKLIVQEDYDLLCSIKSLWHSLRILDFGTQLAESGKIEDYESCNWLFSDIIEQYTETECSWEKIDEIYKPVYNEMASSFRSVCPKT